MYRGVNVRRGVSLCDFGTNLSNLPHLFPGVCACVVVRIYNARRKKGGGRIAHLFWAKWPATRVTHVFVAGRQFHRLSHPGGGTTAIPMRLLLAEDHNKHIQDGAEERFV